MLCSNPTCTIDVSPSELFDGDLCRDCYAEKLVTELKEVGMPEVAARALADDIPKSEPAPRRGTLESFEDRTARILGNRTELDESRSYGVAATLARIEKAERFRDAHTVSDPRECPVCRRQFGGARVDRITCPDGNHCRDLVRRLRAGDPRVDAALRMLWIPPDCEAGDGKLWGYRPDAKHHGQRCVKRAQRDRAMAAEVMAYGATQA